MSIRTGSPADLDNLAAIDMDASTLFERAGLHLDSRSEREVMRAEREQYPVSRACLDGILWRLICR